MMYQVVEVIKRRSSDGGFGSDRIIKCAFHERKYCEEYIKERYWSMLGLGYTSAAVGGDTYKKTYDVETQDFMGIKKLHIDEVVEFILSEVWTPDEEQRV